MKRSDIPDPHVAALDAGLPSFLFRTATEPRMAEYQLYCFAQSGNAYRVALMLNLIGADWAPIYVDFFKGGETRTPKYRSEVNEMGEVPVLVHGARKLTQSGVCLTYLAERAGKLAPQTEDERLEALRWIIFDNQKVNGFLGPYRFLRNFAKTPGDPAVMAFLKGRIDGNLAIVEKRLSSRAFVLGERRPSPMSRSSPICTIRPRSSASTSPPPIRRSASGSSA